MTLTLWPTTSWSSRAIRARSSATAARARSSRSRSSRAARSSAARYWVSFALSALPASQTIENRIEMKRKSPQPWCGSLWTTIADCRGSERDP
jgi:hypothetical protein